MKQIVCLILLSILPVMARSINDRVERSYSGYETISELSKYSPEISRMWDGKSEITRRDFSTFLILILDGIDEKEISYEECLKIERIISDFSNDLEELYSPNVDSLQKKIAAFESLTGSKKKEMLETTFRGKNADGIKVADLNILKVVQEKSGKPTDVEFMKPVTLNFYRTDIKLVITALFENTGFNVTVSDDVKSEVTLNVKNEALYDVFTSLCEQSGATWEANGKLLNIFSRNEIRERIFYIAHASAQEVVNFIQNFKSQRGVITVDQRTNSILVKDTVDSLSKIESIIKSVDVEDSQMEKIITIINLKNVRAEDLQKTLEDLKSSTGKIELNMKSNSFIVNDYRKNIEKMKELTKMLDVVTEDRRIKTFIYNLKYANAKDILNILKSEVFSARATDDTNKISFSLDERTNSIIMSGTQERIDYMKSYVEKLDVRIQQVCIEAKIVEVNLNKQFQHGIDWRKMIPQNDPEKNPLDLNVNLSSGASGGTLNIGSISRNQFQVLLDTIAANTKLKTVSNPSVTTMNNAKATINVGTDIIFTKTSTTGEQSGIETKRIGITLTVQPTISPDGYVSMKVQPEVSAEGGVSQTGELLISTTTADTNVIIKDGETLVMGGLFKENKSDVENKLPVLGDIPFVRGLFKNQKNSFDRREIMIFITPRIIKFPEDMNRLGGLYVH